MSAILPPKYNYIDLFKDLLDLSSDETRANLLYIGDYQSNADQLDYVCIWTSLAATITQAAFEIELEFKRGNSKECGILLPKPGIPLFLINNTHLTNNFWYEVTYRSLRVLDSIYKTVHALYFTGNNLDTYPHKGTSSLSGADERYIKELEDSLGCHRIIHFFMAEFIEDCPLQKMIENDMGYTSDDIIYDINRIHILLAFLMAYRAFKYQEYKTAAEYFQTALNGWKTTKLKKQDKLGPNFKQLCNRCIYVSLGHYHLSSPDAHTKYAYIKKYFTIAVNDYDYQDPEKQVQKVTQMMKSSCLPQKHQDEDSLLAQVEEEIQNLIKQTTKTNTTEDEVVGITGTNPAEKFPFIVKQ